MKNLFFFLVLMLQLSCKAQKEVIHQQPSMEKKEFIYILHLTEKYQDEKNWTAEMGKIMGEHLSYMKNLYETGVSKMIGRTDLDTNNPNLFGLNILIATNFAEAESIAQNDPSVKNGIMRAEVFPFKIVFGNK
jgi:uncharacterized protein YciI